MDIVTHIVVGASASAALFSRRLGIRATLLGGLAGLSPDVDTLFTPFAGLPDSLLMHRGLTHSVFFILIVSLTSTLLVKIKYGKNELFWGGVILVGLASHVMLDLMTNYGTQLLQPFSTTQFSIGNINVIDPFFTIPILLGLLYYLFSRQPIYKRNIANISGLGVAIIYIGFTIVNLIHVKNVFEENFRNNGIVPNQVIVIPSSAGSFYWHGVAITENGWVVSDYSVFDKRGDISLAYYEGDSSLLDSYDPKIVQKIIQFTNGYFLVRKEDDGVRIYHLKCHLAQGYEANPGPSTAFIKLSKSDNEGTVVQSRMMVTDSKGLKLFASRWKRAFGNKLASLDNNKLFILNSDK